MAAKHIRIGLVGNPNTGKTTLFNALTGEHQKTGNYAGVTVEKKEGQCEHNGIEYTIVDLPGIYSLTAYSADEVVTRDFVLHDKPDIIIDVLDSTSIERNLYLCLQFQELGLPVLGALNITDQAEAMGIRINDKKLGELLDIPMVRTIGTRGEGIAQLLDAAAKAVAESGKPRRTVSYGAELDAEILALTRVISVDAELSSKVNPRWLAIKLLEKDTQAYTRLIAYAGCAAIEKAAQEGTKRIARHFGIDAEIVVSEQRYAYIHGAVAESVQRIRRNNISMTERVDAVLLNRYLGLPLFLLILWGIFQITFGIGHYPAAWLSAGFSWLSVALSTHMPASLLRSLLVDGVIGGLSGVLSFVPLIALLFMCISFLEDTGYMARAAFIMDRFLHIFGLHGQSFLPMMVGFGCSVPAIMASRTLKNERDRIITILVTPFMSCGAKLPVYALLAGTFFPRRAGNMVLLMYCIGVGLALLSSWVFRRTVLRGDASPFVMELPPYRMPTPAGLLWHVRDKTQQYIRKAGTVLLAASIIIWVLVTFPRPAPADITAHGQTTMQAADYKRITLEHSIAGRLGKVVEPLVKPLGFDWKIAISAITGFAAKEAVVSTLGVVYTTGSNPDRSLSQALKADKTFNPLVAFVLMLFTLIAPPCIAALSTLRAEAGNAWLGFSIAYSTGVAWLLCAAAYQFGRLLGLGA
jgi:ferrous iron transport protein B